MKKVAIIGASGLIGSRFCQLAKDKLDLICVDEKQVDITQNNLVDKFFEENSFDVIVNFAAFTNVDLAEKERGDKNGLVWRINVQGPINLASASKKHNRLLIQISTDFVFTGTSNNPGPYSENSIVTKELTDNIGWYGYTKAQAENNIMKSGARCAIVRVAYPFYAANFDGKLDFAKNYLKLFDEGKLFPIFTDQCMSVMNVDDMVLPFIQIIKNELEGIYHLVSADTTTPFEFVEYLLNKARNVSGVVQKGLMSDFLKFPGRTPRPIRGGLMTEKTEEVLKIKFKSWRQMVDSFVGEL